MSLLTVYKVTKDGGCGLYVPDTMERGHYLVTSGEFLFGGKLSFDAAVRIAVKEPVTLPAGVPFSTDFPDDVIVISLVGHDPVECIFYQAEKEERRDTMDPQKSPYRMPLATIRGGELKFDKEVEIRRRVGEPVVLPVRTSHPFAATHWIDVWIDEAERPVRFSGNEHPHF